MCCLYWHTHPLHVTMTYLSRVIFSDYSNSLPVLSVSFVCIVLKIKVSDTNQTNHAR